MEGQLHTTVTLKPLRFAFLIPASDRAAILDAIETSTLLWGGVWNPIIPIYERAPQWTARPYESRPTAAQWLTGHLDFFQPDVVVLAEGVGTPHGYGREDVVSLRELHDTARKGEPRYGLSIHHVCRHLFRTRYRFVEHSDQPSFIVPPASAGDSLHSAVVFGRLPEEHTEHLDSRYFRELFRATPGTLDARGLETRLRKGSVSPLTITVATVPRWFGGEPAILVYDHRKRSDLLALWNLRSCVNLIAAVPIAWLPDLQDVTRAAVESLHLEPDERGMGGRWPRVIISPGVQAKQVQEAIDLLKPNIGDSKIWFDEYPELWDYRRAWIRHFGTLRREVRSELETVQVDREGDARIPLLKPEFIEDENVAWSETWANHMEFSYRSGGDDSTIVFPSDVDDVGGLVSPLHGEGIRRVRGGIAIQCSNYSKDMHLHVPTGTELVTWWLQQRGWTASPSGAGRLAAQLLKVARGPRGVPHFCSRPILKAISTHQSPERNGLASKKELLEWLASDDPFDRAFGGGAHRRLQHLLERGILRVGLRVQCSVCGQRGWHSLVDLDGTLNCPSCLAAFPFPAEHPPEGEWRYRAYGPYALPDHARGSFSVALAIAFFYRLRHFKCAYTLGLDLRRAGDHAAADEHLEVDAMLFVQREGWHLDAHTVICECKSLGSFGRADFDRARKLAEHFPDAVLAFVTLKDQLTGEEKKRFIKLLKKLPDIGTPHHQVHRPLLILTPTELHHRLSLNQTWEKASGRAAAFATAGGGRNWFGDLLELCTITQHLYLSDQPAAEDHSASIARLIGRPGYGSPPSPRGKKGSTKKKAKRRTRRGG